MHNKTFNKPGKTPRRKTSFLYSAITGGIVLSIMTISVSLFTYFQPDTARLMLENGLQFGRQLSENLRDRFLSSEPDGAGDIHPGSNIVSEEPPSSLADKEIRELGDISELNMEYSPIPTDSIYSAMLDTAMGPMLYYCQGDRRWADYLYGGADPMKKYGCGPTAVAMVINSFSPSAETAITPVDMADWAAENRQYAPGGGSYHSLIPKALSAYGFEVESVKDRSVGHVTELLSQGNILVALMGKGSLTQNGHFVLFTGLTESGNITIADPNRYENCLKEWDLEQLLSELKESYDSGGPLWVVRLGFS